MNQFIQSALIAAALIWASTQGIGKTISFTSTLEEEFFLGTAQPFSETPAALDVVITLDETAVVDLFEDSGALGQASTYYSAVTSFHYEAFGVGGNSIGSWSAVDVQLTIGDFWLNDGVRFFSNDTTGPDPLDSVLLLFEGDPNLFSGTGLDVLTEDVLKATTNSWIDVYKIVADGAIGARFTVDTDSIVVTDDLPPAVVPLPAGLPLLLAGLGGLALAKRRKLRG